MKKALPIILLLLLGIIVPSCSNSLSAQSSANTSSVDYHGKGYVNYTQMGLVIGGNPGNWINGTLVNASFQTINGYQFHRSLSVGAGIGFAIYTRGPLLPIFVDLRGDLLKRQVTPHYYVQGGYNFPLYPTPEDTDWRQSPTLEGGLMGDAGIGIKIHTSYGIAWTLTGGYRIQEIYESYFNRNDVKIEEDVSYRRISIQLGIAF